MRGPKIDFYTYTAFHITMYCALLRLHIIYLRFHKTYLINSLICIHEVTATKIKAVLSVESPSSVDCGYWWRRCDFSTVFKLRIITCEYCDDTMLQKYPSCRLFSHFHPSAVRPVRLPISTVAAMMSLRLSGKQFLRAQIDQVVYGPFQIFY